MGLWGWLEGKIHIIVTMGGEIGTPWGGGMFLLDTGVRQYDGTFNDGVLGMREGRPGGVGCFTGYWRAPV